jgi:tetratricopeptide (TPR) repeat protein
MIAYFQVRWQTARFPSARETGHALLQEVLEEGKKQRATLADKPEESLFIGLAAIFDALLQQEHSSWISLQLFTQGQSVLQRTIVAYDTMTDAHLGLGLLYFAGADLPPFLRRLWGSVQGYDAEGAIHHLQRAIESGHFSREVSQVFLARIYELEHRYEDAVALGQVLRETFPDNGYFALLTGRSQCARHQYAACAVTLEALAAQLNTAGATLANRDDRFDLYYYLGLAFNETKQYAKAFSAFRQAINEDPRSVRDETLWAKYHLATLYERRGQDKIALQIYHTLLRGRNVEGLYRQVQQRLARLR